MRWSLLVPKIIPRRNRKNTVGGSNRQFFGRFRAEHFAEHFEHPTSAADHGVISPGTGQEEEVARHAPVQSGARGAAGRKACRRRGRRARGGGARGPRDAASAASRRGELGRSRDARRRVQTPGRVAATRSTAHRSGSSDRPRRPQAHPHCAPPARASVARCRPRTPPAHG